MKVIVKETYEDMSKLAAQIIADIIRKKPKAVIGLATGSTPLGTYKELIRMHKEKGMDFSQVVTFNLDEYVDLPPEHDQSYRYFMNQNLFDHINIKKENTHVPDGLVKDIEAFCAEYEKKIKESGGIDVQVLGIGGNGHIAFNEPGSPLDSRTRKVDLTEETIKDNSRFFEKIKDVPRYAISMGIGTILEASKLILLANKASKANAVVKAVKGPVTEEVPASAIQRHPQATVIIEKEAASKLTQKYSS